METILLSEEKPLDSGDLKRLRRHAEKVFGKLELKIHNDCGNGSLHPMSWVGGEGERDSSTTPTTDHTKNQNDDAPITEASFRKRYFDEHGFWVARGFCDSEEASKMKQAMGESVRDHWFPELTTTCDDEEEKQKQQQQQNAVNSFGTDAKSNEARGDPFLESADKVSYFAEPTALDPDSGRLKPEFCDATKKLLALCKAGHGLHLPSSFRRNRDGAETATATCECECDKTITNHDDKNHNKNDNDNNKPSVHEPFFEYTSSSKLLELVVSLGYQDPVVPQSMYIFKNPVVGGAVHSHQDSTFLYTTPKQTCLGLWLALDDATLQNGCLWVRPRSHRELLRRQFLRNPKHRQTNTDTADAIDNDDNDEPKLIFQIHDENSEVSWEGSLPKSVEVERGAGDDEKDENESKEQTQPEIVSSMNFVPVEVKAGDLVVFCGTLDHFSLPNFSEDQRHTFQLHLVEGPNAGIQWSPSNWLHTRTISFLLLLLFC